MSWPAPKLSNAHIDSLGRDLTRTMLHKKSLDPENLLKAFVDISHWRACHGYVMNTFQSNLRSSASEISPEAVVVQRLKRFWSIEKKLRDKPTMRLSQMQDVAGLRVVLPDAATLRKAVTAFTKKRFRHRPLGKDDYLATPRSTGYRSVHLKYAYANPRALAYSGLRVEVQFRTFYQHAWAMAVETIGHNLKSDLKGGSGPTDWLHFFRVAGGAFAATEGLPAEADFAHFDAEQICRETVRLANQLKVEQTLSALKMAAHAVNRIGLTGIRDLQLVELNLDSRMVMVTSFNLARADQANEAYALIETRQRNGENVVAVLVSAESMKTLKSGYASFFLNSETFVSALSTMRALYGTA